MSHSFRYVALSELTTKVGSGSTPRGGKDAYHKTGISLIRSLNIYDYIFKKNNLVFIDENQAQKLKNVIVEENDILLNITGASVCRCTIIPKDVLPARVNQHVSIIRVNPKVLIPQFALHAINSSSLKQGLFNLAMTGATREALTKNDILGYRLPVPSISVQKKIAAILSAYDDLIENNKRRITLLEKMAEEIYREWFVRFRFPGYQTAEFNKGIPKGWRYEKLDDICVLIKRGISPKYDDDSSNLVINQKCIRNNRIDLSEARNHGTKVSKEKYIRFGDALVNSTGVGTLGRVSVVEFDPEKITIDSHVTICRADDGKVNPVYLANTITKLQNYFEFIAAGSTGQVELNRSLIAGLKVLVPERGLMYEFEQKIINIIQQKQYLFAINKNLTATKESLLPRLISGKLSVEDLDIQFPPSMQEDSAA